MSTAVEPFGCPAHYHNQGGWRLSFRPGRRLNARFVGSPLVEMVGKAQGTSVGELPMSICSDSPTISTLDLIVAQYGVPRYTKIEMYTGENLDFMLPQW